MSECHQTEKQREPSVEWKHADARGVRKKYDNRFPLCLQLSVSEHLVLQPGVLRSRVLSFYRILMSSLPPPLFPTDRD